MLSLLQPGIPTWPIQTTNSSYQGISCYCSLLGVLKPSFFIFRIPYNTQLPCLTGFCMFCVFFLLVMVVGFCFVLLFPLLDSALTTHSLSTALTAFPLCHDPAWVTFCSTLMPGACPCTPSHFLTVSQPPCCVCSSVLALLFNALGASFLCSLVLKRLLCLQAWLKAKLLFSLWRTACGDRESNNYQV